MIMILISKTLEKLLIHLILSIIFIKLKILGMKVLLRCCRWRQCAGAAAADDGPAEDK
jgi:hypothetical protein